MLKSKLMVGTLIAATALSTPAWAHHNDFAVGALLGLGVGAILADGVIVGPRVYAAPPPVVVYEPRPVYVVPRVRYRTYYYGDYDDGWRVRHWRHRHWDDRD